MAINLSRAWTGSTIAPQAQAQIPPSVVGAGFNLGQNQASQFYNSLLGAMLGGLGGGGNNQPAAPSMSPQQGNAINFAIQQIGAENWNRDRQADLSRFMSSAPLGTGGLPGISPIISPLGGGNIPVVNPLIEQSLSNARLAPSLSLGTAASAFGSGGYGMQPASVSRNIAPMSGWVSPGFGF